MDFNQCGGGTYWYEIGFDPMQPEPIRMEGGDYVFIDYNPDRYSDAKFIQILCENKAVLTDWLKPELKCRNLCELE